MTPNQIAFFIGLFGSLHCIGMCGPLAFAVPAMGSNKLLLVWNKLVYQLGRVISYTLLGLLIGLIGRQLWLLGLQRTVSILSGLFILFAGLTSILKLRTSRGNVTTPGFFNRAMVYALRQRWGHLLVGILNGFLPCGFVYLALTGALNTHSAVSSAVYMFWFGVGTVPLMLVAAVGSGFLTASLRRQLNRLVPYFMLLLGVWFVLRGLELDIPYLSPAVQGSTTICR